MKSRAAQFVVLAAGLALAGCPRTTSQPEVGGETNWLRVCKDRGGCGVGSCVCGVCTIECSSESRCSGSFAGSCVDTASGLGASACAEAQRAPAGLCLPGCSGDAECGAGFACRDSVCVTATVAAHFDSEPPAVELAASLCRSAERCELGELCDWTRAQARVLECYMPFAGPYTARCGRYDSVVSRGTDSAITYYYGQDGALVGTNSVGLGGEGCFSYDDSFTRPESCTPTSPACAEDDAGMADAGASDAGALDSGDAGATDGGTSDASRQDATAAICDCANEEVSLECVCSQSSATCRTFEQVTTNVLCTSGPPGLQPRLERGCGYRQVVQPGGMGSQINVYQGADDKLVGAWVTGDLVWGACVRNSYRTRMPDLLACGDYSTCDLCPTGPNPCQL